MRKFRCNECGEERTTRPDIRDHLGTTHGVDHWEDQEPMVTVIEDEGDDA